MDNILKFITNLVNYVHDLLIILTKSMGLNLTDKQLHFLVIGIFGIVLFIVVDKAFKWLAHYGIMTISFIYTFTVLIVVVFAIEIEQGITHRGNMEFQDIVQGLWGFIVIFCIYLGIMAVTYGIRKVGKKLRH